MSPFWFIAVLTIDRTLRRLISALRALEVLLMMC